MLSRIFGEGSIYETLDLDDSPRTRSPRNAGDPGSGSSILLDGPPHSRAGYSAVPTRHPRPQLGNASHAHHHISNSHYPHYENTLPNLNEEDDANDDVPGSLLVEEQPVPRTDGTATTQHRDAYYEEFSPEREQDLDALESGTRRTLPGRGGSRTPDPTVWLGLVDPKERALWKWANVENLDVFLQQVYGYFIGKGIYNIVLARFLNLATIAFVVGFSTFLMACIDWPRVRGSHHLSQVILPHGLSKISFTGTFILWSFALFWIIKLLQYIIDIHRLRDLQRFYYYLLEIDNNDLQTISWQEIVRRLMRIRQANPSTAEESPSRRRNALFSKQRMDALDIASRIMRKDNYFIALVNRDVLDLSLPVPFLTSRPMLSKTLEWSLNLCIIKYVFDEQGQLRPVFTKDVHKRLLSDGLRRRFKFVGFMNLIFAPFIVIYLLLLHFFRYFEEYHSVPGALGSRQYTPLAQWKFREFNELYHIFKKRMDFSSKFASKYIDQFPKETTAQLFSFVTFISGSFAAVLFFVSVFEPELFLTFQLTPDRTVFFYFGIFTAIFAAARNMIPEENLVFEPEPMLAQVIEYTRYCPEHWNGRLHSDEVKREFSGLYQLKLVIFLEEVLSVLTTPFVLWFSLPNSSDRIVDFFRENTVHVDAVGYICTYSQFVDFLHVPGKDARRRTRVSRDKRTDQKMEHSIMNFRALHPDWRPNPINQAMGDDDVSAYVNEINDPHRSLNAYRMGAIPHQRRTSAPSQPYLGFAATSQLGGQSTSRIDQSRGFFQSEHRGSLRRPHPLFSPPANGEESDLLQEMDERGALEDDEEEEERERFTSELGDSFLSPSEAVRQGEVEGEGKDQGVFGLLNHLYQEAGTGKGVGL